MVVATTIRPQNQMTPIEDLIDTPKDVTFVQALNEKYVEQEDIDNQFTLAKDKSISTEITFVGFGTVTCVQRQLRRLVNIDLSGRHISSAGNLQEIANCLDRVRVLNLAHNSLSWQEIIKILACLPNLRDIILTSNNLKSIDDIQFPNEPLKGLISLTLGKVDLNWPDIVSILSQIWRYIEQIDLWDSQMTSLSFGKPSQDQFVAKINSIGLSRNSFPDIAWISDLGPTEQLTSLDLSRCHLENLEFSPSILKQLKNLKLLNISYNDIQYWRSISVLNNLPTLTNLICNDNPIFITTKSAKALTVARIANLVSLNREEVSKPYRRDSEILYLKLTYKDYVDYKSGKNGMFPLDHPRYDELIELYGIPEDLITKQAVEKYITVDLCFEDKIISKKLPCDMRVSNLQMLCKRLFKLKPSVNIEIICSEQKPSDEPISYPLDKDGQTLHFFSVKSGHRLLIKQLDT